MKLLINLCAHDGIISHYAGVGTIVRRYIEAILKMVNDQNIDYTLNLYTLEFNNDSMGYNKEILQYHKSLKNTNVFIVSNGTNGISSFGNIYNWEIASRNTANAINAIKFDDYDYVVTLCNDTPFALLSTFIKESNNSYVVWIPHSTGKVYNEDLSLSKKNETINERVKMEQEVIDYINNAKNRYVASTGLYIKKHLIDAYGLKKNIDLINGELLFRKNEYEENERMSKILKEINKNDTIILSFGRAENYKNLDKAMILANEMNTIAVVITQQYYPNQPIIADYKRLAFETNSLLYVDEPFSLPQYIIKYFEGKIIMLVPSEREIFGLIINEIRRFNKKNVLIVANDRGGLHEQIIDCVDGVLVNLDNIEDAAKKISRFLTFDAMNYFNEHGQINLKENYDLYKNFNGFIRELLGDAYDKVFTSD